MIFQVQHSFTPAWIPRRKQTVVKKSTAVVDSLMFILFSSKSHSTIFAPNWVQVIIWLSSYVYDKILNVSHPYKTGQTEQLRTAHAEELTPKLWPHDIHNFVLPSTWQYYRTKQPWNIKKSACSLKENFFTDVKYWSYLDQKQQVFQDENSGSQHVHMLVIYTALSVSPPWQWSLLSSRGMINLQVASSISSLSHDISFYSFHIFTKWYLNFLIHCAQCFFTQFDYNIHT